MSDFPFHVAGGNFTPSQRPLQILESLLHHAAPPAPIGVQTSRRRKLWEIPHKFHCPVIGTCFEVSELRALMKKVMHFPTETTDFVLHTTAVGACESRGQLSELLQKQLEKRYQTTIRRFAAAKTGAELQALWQEATRTGCELPAALWSTWSHPACDSSLEHAVYADIHMIQHQVGSGTRVDLAALKNSREETRQLHQQLRKARRDTDSLREQMIRENRALSQTLIDLRAELAGRDARIAELTGRLEAISDSLPDLRERQSLLRRVNDAEARNIALTSHAAAQEAELIRTRQLLCHADDTISQLLAIDDAAATPPGEDSASLTGKCVLCVGGRTGAVDAYRQLVEQCGGRFMHHDGGLEESLHRIDGALAAADLVICQAGCISHNAYWRVKEQCKRRGKPCLFVRSAGVSSFGRIVSQACMSEQAEQT